VVELEQQQKQQEDEAAKVAVTIPEVSMESIPNGTPSPDSEATPSDHERSFFVPKELLVEPTNKDNSKVAVLVAIIAFLCLLLAAAVLALQDQEQQQLQARESYPVILEDTDVAWNNNETIGDTWESQEDASSCPLLVDDDESYYEASSQDHLVLAVRHVAQWIQKAKWEAPVQWALQSLLKGDDSDEYFPLQ